MGGVCLRSQQCLHGRGKRSSTTSIVCSEKRLQAGRGNWCHCFPGRVRRYEVILIKKAAQGAASRRYPTRLEKGWTSSETLINVTIINFSYVVMKVTNCHSSVIFGQVFWSDRNAAV